MRKFSLANDEYAIERAGIGIFRWGALDAGIAHQLGFEEQYLSFHRYLLENLESVPAEKPEFAPRPIGLSLRAGALKAYVVFACSIIEGVLAYWGEREGIIDNPQKLRRLPFGALLKAWCTEPDTPREDLAPIWDHLELLLEYRNFIHLGRAAENERAYWDNILAREAELLTAVDTTLDFLSDQCDGI